eukprot:Seg154.8 transcript_id=Seg154.8/GoldUCD/mRNA.D3Y31 product="Chymotrypsinogen 2" protein_id=Seg154.8/GoldUCD/D3Y31
MKLLVLLLAVAFQQVYSQGCADRYSQCPRWKGLCTNASYRRFMETYCKQTCGLCGTPPQPPTAGPPQPPSGQCGSPQVQAGRVIAGDDAKRGAWPWQILMLYRGRTMCGGTLVAPNWVVTAAHCIDGKESQARSFTVRVGEHNSRSNEGSEDNIVVERIFKHPSYDRRVINNDIALLKLSRSARYSKYVSPACLPQQGASVPVGSNCYITGWGKIKHPGNMHYILQQGRLPVVSKQTCAALNTRISRIPITDKMVCAGSGGSSRTGGCHGDSGGPFVCQSGGKWFLQGAVSWGSGTCQSSKSYTVFARVAQFRSWIDQTMRY